MSRVRVHQMRVIDSTLHGPTILAYTVRELPAEGRVRVFEYAYVEAQRIPRELPSATESER